ncbi:TVP38/TMEM64 family protein [Thalassotalea montiporae]
MGLPRQVAALSTGMLFGAKAGFLVATAATISGCMLTFLASRYLFARWVYQRFPHKSSVIHRFLSINTFTKALIIRILPLGSNFITNIVAGATKIPFAPYVAGSALGFIPQMVIFSLAGAGIKLAAETQQQISVALAGLALGLMLMLYIKHKYKLQAKKKLSQG